MAKTLKTSFRKDTELGGLRQAVAVLAASVALAPVPLRAQATAANSTIANNATSVKVPTQAGSENIYLYGATAAPAPHRTARLRFRLAPFAEEQLPAGW
jgi:hypothetical protein